MKKLLSVVLSVLMVAIAVTVGFTVFATEGKKSGSNPKDSTNPTDQTLYTPAAVKGLAASDVKTTSLTLNWKQSKYATRYRIFRAVEADNGTIISYKKYATISGISNTSFKETGLKAGRVYKYRVYSSRVKNGVTTYGDPASIVVMTVPQKVSKFKVTGKSTSSISLSWSKGNASVSKFLLYRTGEKPSGKGYGKFKLIKTLKSSTKSYKDSNLNSARIFKYKIVANRTKAGISKNSDEKILRTITKLNTPKNFTNKKATTKSITLSWSKVTRARKYEVSRKPAGSGKYKKVGATKKASFTDKSVKSGANYTYRVRALRKLGDKTYYSGYAKVSSSTAVTGVKGVTAKSYLRRALLTWNGVSSAAGYDVFIKSGKSFKYQASTYYPRYLSCKLKSGKVYTFAIKSYKTVGSEKIYGSVKYVKVKINGKAYGKTPKGTWVEVCTETQTLYMYVKNKLYLSTPVVTGNYGALATTPGYHHVNSKQSPSRLRGSYGGSSWDVTVSYWLGFTADGQGIHDSTWRGAYGGEIYKGDGSHGCVNTPYGKVAKIYSKAFVGMPVIVY